MRWTKASAAQYITAQAYVDTLLIPLIPIALENTQEIERSAGQHEALQFFAGEMEKELAGRIMLAPAYTYLKQPDMANERMRLTSWLKTFEQQSFRHFFLLTYDPAWRKEAAHLDGELIWMPYTAFQSLPPTELQHAIRGQVKEVMELMCTAW